MAIRIVSEDDVCVTAEEMHAYEEEYRFAQENFSKERVPSTIEQWIRLRRELNVLNVIAQSMRNNGVNIKGELNG